MRTIILIVDNEDIVRRLIRLALVQFDDVDCIEATDAEEALRNFEALSRPDRSVALGRHDARIDERSRDGAETVGRAS